ncbi:hypothetical protein Pla108_17370 [Botrimarina colliarenosi]|uniref:Uncharacterized protein n=1 Tax=Botrimarina colliarenosi TaxID=2528001 RepID=A0A5C6AEI8_9BACT|nr:hypothetical protein Pla108_17370 [Botrimarina colliarenosi]
MVSLACVSLFRGLCRAARRSPTAGFHLPAYSEARVNARDRLIGHCFWGVDSRNDPTPPRDYAGLRRLFQSADEESPPLPRSRPFRGRVSSPFLLGRFSQQNERVTHQGLQFLDGSLGLSPVIPWHVRGRLGNARKVRAPCRLERIPTSPRRLPALRRPFRNASRALANRARTRLRLFRLFSDGEKPSSSSGEEHPCFVCKQTCPAVTQPTDAHRSHRTSLRSMTRRSWPFRIHRWRFFAHSVALVQRLQTGRGN